MYVRRRILRTDRARSFEKEALNALDNLRDFVGPVGTGTRHFLHLGWIHSPVISAGPGDPGD